MCGIAGVLRVSGAGATKALLQRMIARVRYRGPDETDVMVDGPAGLAHTRLSIIDLATGCARGRVIGVADSMALVGLLSTQLAVQQLTEYSRSTNDDGRD
ncbi:hypothetical protein ACFL6C_06280 [Myxococcota bacterium]